MFWQLLDGLWVGWNVGSAQNKLTRLNQITAAQLEMQTVAAMPDDMKAEYWRRKHAEVLAEPARLEAERFRKKSRRKTILMVVAGLYVFGLVVHFLGLVN